MTQAPQTVVTDLAGRSLIVTGGGSGIGAAFARQAAKAGAKVTVGDRDEDAGREVVAGIAADGGAVLFAPVDVADEAQVARMVAAAIDAFGPLHGAFNNAGLPGLNHRGDGHDALALTDFPREAFDRTIAVNLTGVFLCMKHEIAAMLRFGGGAVVNTASTCGVVAIPEAADYVAAKHGVIGLTRSAALDYAARNIRVNAVMPGLIRSRMSSIAFHGDEALDDWGAKIHPIGRAGEPVEVAAAALWLLSDAASLITGIAMPVDGGMTIT